MATTKEKLTFRERIGLHLILVALHIVKPWDYNHEVSKYFDAIEKEIKMEG
ncbi:MAG: hypothetical protein WC822_05725 [Candidatus Paceibacterota bacterium]|jgi:hypothetical protein